MVGCMVLDCACVRMGISITVSRGGHIAGMECVLDMVRGMITSEYGTSVCITSAVCA